MAETSTEGPRTTGNPGTPVVPDGLGGRNRAPEATLDRSLPGVVGKPRSLNAAQPGGKVRFWFESLAALPVNRLVALAKPEWRRIAVGTVFLALGSSAGLAFPWAVKQIIDGAFVDRNTAAVDHAAMLLLLIFTLQAIAIGMRSWLFTVAGERVVSDLRLRLYAHVLDQEVGFFDQSRTGELLSRLSVDTGVLQNAVSVNISMALRNVAMAIGGVALLAWTSPTLTAVMLLVVPPIALGSVFYGRKIRRIASSVQAAYARANEVAEETISGIRTVRSHAGEGRERARYGLAIEDAFGLAVRRTTLSAIFMGFASLGGYGAVAIVVWYGGRIVGEGVMSVGDLTSFVLYTLMVALSLGTLGGLWADLMRAVGAAERVFGLMDREGSLPNEGGVIPDRIDGHVRFEHIEFSYPARPDVPVLRDFSIEARPGQVVALVGPSGAGKSTVRALLSRLYDPDAGRILLDGRELHEIDPTWLRRSVGVVAQEPLLFSASVADNIRYACPEATDEQVREAARAANADAFISDFPEGYQTEVGERGVRLSGGQKQRVAIARALLANPRILVLDEATSALDAESEHLVKEALDRLMVGRTTFVIAHRLSTVRDADVVAVLEGGRVAESGAHQDLVQRDGLYRRLVERQFAA